MLFRLQNWAPVLQQQSIVAFCKMNKQDIAKNRKETIYSKKQNKHIKTKQSTKNVRFGCHTPIFGSCNFPTRSAALMHAPTHTEINNKNAILLLYKCAQLFEQRSVKKMNNNKTCYQVATLECWQRRPPVSLALLNCTAGEPSSTSVHRR